MSRRETAATEAAPRMLPQSSGRSVLPTELPTQYSPRVAEHAQGPFLEATCVTPQGIEFHGARTYLVETPDEISYLALRIVIGRDFYGWWKI